MSTSQGGIARMPGIVAAATGDIRHRLWSLYWLVRMTEHLGEAVELGVRGGDSTRALLCGCLDSNSTLHSYDIEDCSRAITDPALRECWEFTLCNSVKAALSRSRPGLIALVFVDTDHTFQTTRAEIAAWAPHVRPGGCMVFHDYWLHDLPRDENAGHGVKMAVDEWCDARTGEWLLETWDAGPDGDTGMAVMWRRS